MDQYDWVEVSEMMAGTIDDAMENANATLGDDKRIAYHISIDWVHCAVWLRPEHVMVRWVNASLPMIMAVIAMTFVASVRTHAVPFLNGRMVRLIVASMGSD